jgi:hypothetical protein
MRAGYILPLLIFWKPIMRACEGTSASCGVVNGTRNIRNIDALARRYQCTCVSLKTYTRILGEVERLLPAHGSPAATFHKSGIKSVIKLALNWH